MPLTGIRPPNIPAGMPPPHMVGGAPMPNAPPPGMIMVQPHPGMGPPRPGMPPPPHPGMPLPQGLVPPPPVGMAMGMPPPGAPGVRGMPSQQIMPFPPPQQMMMPPPPQQQHQAGMPTSPMAPGVGPPPMAMGPNGPNGTITININMPSGHMVQGPNGPMFVPFGPPAGPPQMMSSHHHHHMQQQQAMMHMQHMQGGPMQAPHMGMPPPIPTSPKGGAGADKPSAPQATTAGAKPAGLNVAAQSFVPSQLRGAGGQQTPPQQFAPPPMYGGIMPNGQMSPQAMAYFRQQQQQQQQQQHMMFQQHQMQQHMHQQQQFAQASQPPLDSRRARGAPDGGVNAAEEGDDEGERRSPQLQHPAPPPVVGMPFATPPVRTSPGQGNGTRSAAKDSAAGLHDDMPQSPLTILVDAADNSDSSTNTDNGLDNAQKWSKSPSTQQQSDDLANGSADLEVSIAADLSFKSSSSIGLAASPQSVGGADAPRSQQKALSATAAGGLSSSSSSPNLSAVNPIPSDAASSWKQKLQLNMTVQMQQQQAGQPQPHHKQLGSGRSNGGASPLANSHHPRSPSSAAGAQAVAAAPAQPRPGASSRTSAALMAEPPQPPPGTLKVQPYGRYTFHPADPRPGGESKPLPLVRGLLNSDADNNCFLNVIVQSLWHLAAFRGPMLATPWAAIEAKAGSSSTADSRVMAAVWRIFRAMDADPAADGLPVETPKTSSSSAGVSPCELRAALCGQSTIHVDPTDMHDAGEVFAEILGILHRAETGTRPHAISASSSGASAAVALEGDLQLPRRVKVQRLKQLSSLSPLEGPSSPQAAAAAASPYAAALMAGVPSTAALSAAQDLATQRPATLVHGVFGLDIQMPCPPSDSDSRGSSPSVSS